MRILNLVLLKLYFAGERAMVVIEAAGSQGTGTFIKVLNKKFILTCTHVVFKVNMYIL